MKIQLYICLFASALFSKEFPFPYHSLHRAMPLIKESITLPPELKILAENTHFSVLLEVGASLGHSTRILLDTFPDVEHVLVHGYWSSDYLLFKQFLSNAIHVNIEHKAFPLRGKLASNLRRLEIPIDCIICHEISYSDLETLLTYFEKIPIIYLGKNQEIRAIFIANGGILYNELILYEATDTQTWQAKKHP